MAPFKALSFILLFAVTTVACSSGNGNTEQVNANQPATEQAPAAEASGEWISLWDGETFNNWTVNENPESFTIEDGKIVVDGPRAHLFYDGPVANANFTDFEFQAEVYTYPEANSGIFFHTQFQEGGWPAHGYEAQVNATHSDPIKTGSLYSVENVMNDAPHEDEEWCTYQITVIDRDITLHVTGNIFIDATEHPNRNGSHPHIIR